MWNVSKVCTPWPPRSSRKSISSCVKILSDNSSLGPEFPKNRKIMLTSHTKLSAGAEGLRLYTPAINLIIDAWSFSDWYGVTVILLARAHFLSNKSRETLCEKPLSHRLLKKFKTCSVVIMSLFVPINDSDCLINVLYLVLVISRNYAFDVLTVVSILT